LARSNAVLPRRSIPGTSPSTAGQYSGETPRSTAMCSGSKSFPAVGQMSFPPPVGKKKRFSRDWQIDSIFAGVHRAAARALEDYCAHRGKWRRRSCVRPISRLRGLFPTPASPTENRVEMLLRFDPESRPEAFFRNSASSWIHMRRLPVSRTSSTTDPSTS